MTQGPVKVSVLASGAILLDGQNSSLENLRKALRAASDRNAPVLYYREGAAEEPPPEAQSVLQLIVANRLAISLSTKPDFSDWVDQQGISHPREAVLNTAMELVFAKARRHAAASRQLVIVRPDQQYLLLPAPPPGSMNADAAKPVTALVPSESPRRIAVIADTSFATSEQPPAMQDVVRSIPFFGLLIGMTYLGHAVWIFEATAETLVPGCRDADVLLIDSGVVGRLPKDWGLSASAVMRNSNIILRDRASQKFLLLKTAGTVKGRIEFPVG